MSDPAARRAEAEAALADPGVLARVLAPWEQPAGALAALVGPLAIPETPAIARLVAWAASEEPAGPGEDPEARDGRVFAAAEPRATDAAERAAAALVLLSRLGEALDRHERRVEAWPASPRDAEARRIWEASVGGDPIAASTGFRELWGPAVRASFVGVASVLRLPRGAADTLGEGAVQQLDLAVLLAQGDIAARVVETAGEPIGALAAVLGPAARAQVDACVARRPPWRALRDHLRRHGGEPSLPSGADAVVLRRLADHLRAGRAPAHPLGLPGWGVVVANRARMRGRLRAAAALDPAALGEAVLALDALHARTAEAVGRFAWEWAWREARSSFGFDPERLRPPPWVVREALPPAIVFERSAIRTFLLLVAGRGAWDDLVRWLSGAPGRALGRAFYRCLAQLPDRLADSGTPAGPRSYEQLRAHLAAGGLDACRDDLHTAARAVSRLPKGRTLPARLKRALAPWWDASTLPPPRHHLPGFRAGLVALLATAAP